MSVKYLWRSNFVSHRTHVGRCCTLGQSQDCEWTWPKTHHALLLFDLKCTWKKVYFLSEAIVKSSTVESAYRRLKFTSSFQCKEIANYNIWTACYTERSGRGCFWYIMIYRYRFRVQTLTSFSENQECKAEKCIVAITAVCCFTRIVHFKKL